MWEIFHIAGSLCESSDFWKSPWSTGACDIPERYAVEVMNRFAALDLIDREPEEL